MRTAAERRAEDEIRKELAGEREELTTALDEVREAVRGGRRAAGLVVLTAAVAAVPAVLRHRARRSV